MSKWIVVWKEAPGPRVSTVVDAFDEPVQRDEAYLDAQKIPVLDDPDEVLRVLKRGDGCKIAITPEHARAMLGWDL